MLSPSERPRAREDRETVETVRAKNKEFLWIDRNDERSETVEAEARRHYSARIAARKQEAQEHNLQQPEAPPDVESLPDPASLKAVNGFELAFDTIGLRVGAKEHAKSAGGDSEEVSGPSNLQRHIAHKICSGLVNEMIDDAVARSRRDKTPLRYLPRAPTGLRRTHDWPSTSR